jgi:hypothetical protein
MKRLLLSIGLVLVFSAPALADQARCRADAWGNVRYQTDGNDGSSATNRCHTDAWGNVTCTLN